MQLLIITTMKPMIGSFVIEQTNSVLSWTKLRIRPKIIVFGDDEGVPEFCAKHNIQNEKDIPKTVEGVPFINEIIRYGYTLMDNGCEYIMYLHSDILLMDDFCDTFEAFCRDYPNVRKCLLTSIRYDVERYNAIDYNNENWREVVRREWGGKYSSPTAIDLFLHKRNNYIDMPEFIIGKYWFDPWMIDYAIKNFEITIDMTKTVKIYHHFGKWYQHNKIVERDEKNIDGKLKGHNFKLFENAGCRYKVITDCKYYTDYNGGCIRFIRK